MKFTYLTIVFRIYVRSVLAECRVFVSSFHHPRWHSHRSAMPRYGLSDHGSSTDGGVFANGGLVDDFHACATVNPFLDKHLTLNVARRHECRVILDYGVVADGAA